MELTNLNLGDGVRRRLEASLKRLSHAYIISGPSESANRALAQWMAAAYVCSGGGEQPCGVCSNCRKAQGGIHPDIIRLAAPEDKQSISVEQVRQLRADAYVRPNEARRKVFIIEGSQMAGKDGAQNALLKVLEDGPDYLAFLILAEQPQQLLTTIRSRCEVLSLTAQEEDAPELPGETLQKASELARLLLDGQERELVEYTVGIENMKWNRETMAAFLSAVEDALRPQLARDPKRVTGLLEHLKEIRLAAPFNVGSGHLLGWLAAGR